MTNCNLTTLVKMIRLDTSSTDVSPAYMKIRNPENASNEYRISLRYIQKYMLGIEKSLKFGTGYMDERYLSANIFALGD